MKLLIKYTCDLNLYKDKKAPAPFGESFAAQGSLNGFTFFVNDMFFHII